MEYIAMMIRNN